MDNPEPNLTVQNLHNQYVSLLKEERFSSSEAEAITKFQFNKWDRLRKLNPDKLAYLMSTQKLTDESIYLYMISLFNKDTNIDKVINSQKIR